jgi:hypothetical protein
MKNSSELKHAKWIFSDESMFVLNPTRRKIWQFPGEESEAVYQDYQGYPIKGMVWAAIGPGWKSDLFFVHGSQTAESYIDMLEENCIFPILDIQYGRQKYIWMQDGASSHTAAATIDYLHRLDVKILEGPSRWPPCSPDLNPIEQFWGLMKALINTSDCLTAEDLFRECKRVWDSISMDKVDKAVRSFEARVLTCDVLGGRSLNGHWNIVREFQERGRGCEMAVTTTLREQESALADFIQLSDDIRQVWPDQGGSLRLGDLLYMGEFLQRIDDVGNRLYPKHWPDSSLAHHELHSI